MITVENIASHELVGLHAQVTGSSNKCLIGLQGVVADETKSMLCLRDGRRRIMVPKAHSTWRFTVRGCRIVLDGSMIQKRPHERLGRR
jgi:ribonuclease P protein subunit POP4